MEKMVINNDILFGRVVELLNEGKDVTIPVKGYSMLPFIRGEKDLVVLRYSEDIAPDDIVLFSNHGRYTLHRVIAIENGVARIMGDGVYKAQEFCEVDKIFGKAVKILKAGKREVDPYKPSMLRRVHLWRKLLPIRRWLLIAWRLLPWNWWILKQQRSRRKKLN